MRPSGPTGKKPTKRSVASYSLERKEKATSDNNKAQCHGKDSALPGQDDPPVAEEAVLPWEHFPFPPQSLYFLLGVVLDGRGRHRQRPRVYLLVLAVLHRVTLTVNGNDEVRV